MADPITIGALAASALAMAGEAMLKGAVGEAGHRGRTNERGVRTSP
jgi:hypothetical protein